MTLVYCDVSYTNTMPKDVTKLQISYRKHVTVFVLCLWNLNGGMWGLVNEEMDVMKEKTYFRC